MVRVIVIQGNIGSGKSTWVNHLKERYINRPDICFLQEPVDEWLSIKDANGVNVLEHYYNDQHKYAFMFQMMAYISRLSILKRAIESNKYRIIITERCLFTDRIYNKWFDEFMNIGPVHYKHIYLRTDPLVSKMRVDKRARKEETIPLEYLEKCHAYHDRWLMSSAMDNVVVLDANQDIEANPDISHWNYEVSKLI